MAVDNEKHQKIKDNIKTLINNSLSSDDEFKTLLGHAYANLTSKNSRSIENVLKKLKDHYDVDLTNDVDNLRTLFYNKKSKLKIKND